VTPPLCCLGNLGSADMAAFGVHSALGHRRDNRRVIEDAYLLLMMMLLVASCACGPYAVLLAARKTFGGAFGMILVGLGVGVGGIAASFKANAAHFDAMRRSGQEIINDMPGFGQALLLAAIILYFGSVLLIAIVAAAWRGCRVRAANK
jgi:hypothetical protein